MSGSREIGILQIESYNYMNRAFNIFIKIHTDENISDIEKKTLLDQFKRAKERKIIQSKKKNILHPSIDIKSSDLLKNEKKQTKSYKKLREEFYNSKEWRSLRYIILKEQTGKCQFCGRSRKDGVVLHVDHIVPLSIDWSKRLDKDNLQVLCADCNLGKSNTDEIDWR